MQLPLLKLKRFRPEQIDETLCRALQHSLYNNLIRLFPAMALVLALTSVYHFLFSVATRQALGLSLVSLTAALVLLLHGTWLKRHPDRYTSIELHAVFMALVVYIDSMAHLAISGNPIHTINLMVLVMGVGIYLLSTHLVLTVLIASVVGWLLMLLWVYSGRFAPWLHYGTALFFSNVLAYIVHTSRVQSFEQMHLYFVQTQQKQAALERALQNAREIQERYKRFSEATNEGVIIHDNARIVDVNEAVAEMSGYTVDELIGMNAMTLVKPEYQLKVQRAIATGEEQPYEIEAIRKNGETFYAEICGKVIKSKGAKYRVVAVRDITERKKAELALKESETWLRLLTRQIPAIHWTTDTHLKLTSLFGAGIRNMAFETQPIGEKSLHDFFAGVQELPQLVQEHQLALKGESREFEFQWDMKYYRANIEPLRDQKNQIIGTIGVALDITLQKRAESEIKKSLHEKEVLLKEIHHRVKNNMQIISSMLTLQARSVKDHAFMEIIKESQDRIKSLALVHENLYLSSDLAHLNFAEYIRQLAQTLLRSHESVPSHIQLKLDLQPLFLDLDYAIPCGLVLNELLTNALKYAFPKEHPSDKMIEIKLYQTDEKIYLEVRDNGIGLQPEDSPAGGAGLGLQLVHSLIEQIEGKIQVESKDGTRFQIVFPKPVGAESDDTVPAFQEVKANCV